MNITVNFSKVPLMPYEWSSYTLLSNIKLLRVNSQTLLDLLTYECTLNYKDKTLLISDTKNSCALRLSNGKVTSRSFLLFDEDLDACEFSSSLKTTHLDYTKTNTKLKYPDTLSEEEQIKSYLINTISSLKDESKSKYLYYLYFNDISDYSKTKLLTSIKTTNSSKNYDLYKFLTQN